MTQSSRLLWFAQAVIVVTKRKTQQLRWMPTNHTLRRVALNQDWGVLRLPAMSLNKYCVNKQYGRGQSAATIYASKLLISGKREIEYESFLLFCIPVVWFRVCRCYRRAPIFHTACASAHPLCWRVCVLQFDKPKNTNNACAAQFVVLCMVKGAVARSAAQLQASLDASNRSFPVIRCEWSYGKRAGH